MRILFYIILAFVGMLLLVQYLKRRRVRRLTDPRHDHMRN